MEKDLGIIADVFSALQGDEKARDRVNSSKKKIHLYYNSIVITDENGEETTFTVM